MDISTLVLFEFVHLFKNQIHTQNYVFTGVYLTPSSLIWDKGKRNTPSEVRLRKSISPSWHFIMNIEYKSINMITEMQQPCNNSSNQIFVFFVLQVIQRPRFQGGKPIRCKGAISLLELTILKKTRWPFCRTPCSKI